MTSICSSQERLAARSGQDVAAPTDTLFTVGAVALGSAAVVAAGLDQAALVGAGQGASLVTPAILALVSAATVAFSRTLPDRGAVLSAAIALVAAAVLVTVLGPGSELSAVGRLLGGLGLGAVVAIAIERAVTVVASSRADTAGVLSTGLGTGIVLGVSAGTVLAGL